MGRLTGRDKQGNWWLNGVEWSELHPGTVITEETYQRLYGALCKLRDYENSRFTPDDLNSMRIVWRRWGVEESR